MNATLLLRIASFIALLFAVGHTMGHPWTPGPASVVETMKSVSFNAMGSNRSYWDFYLGFGVSISVYMFTQAALLWLLAGLARTQSAAAHPFIALLLASNIANGLIAWRYLFIVPVVLSAAMVFCLALALVASRRRVGVG